MTYERPHLPQDLFPPFTWFLCAPLTFPLLGSTLRFGIGASCRNREWAVLLNPSSCDRGDLAASSLLGSPLRLGILVCDGTLGCDGQHGLPGVVHGGTLALAPYSFACDTCGFG